MSNTAPTTPRTREEILAEHRELQRNMGAAYTQKVLAESFLDQAIERTKQLDGELRARHALDAAENAAQPAQAEGGNQ